MESITHDEWFTFKNFRVPPPVAKAILDSVCTLLCRPRDWPSEQMLISDNLVCARNGDEDGVRNKFDCKLVQMMKTYDVFKYTDYYLNDGDAEINKAMSDQRIKPGSYYVVSLGQSASQFNRPSN